MIIEVLAWSPQREILLKVLAIEVWKFFKQILWCHEHV